MYDSPLCFLLLTQVHRFWTMLNQDNKEHDNPRLLDEHGT